MVERVPFLSLAMDLPPAPLYKDVMEKNIIPQARCQCCQDGTAPLGSCGLDDGLKSDVGCARQVLRIVHS